MPFVPSRPMPTTDPGYALRSGDRHDVIVVGADPSGVATALLLARRSLRVVLLDRRSRPPTTDTTAPLLRAGVLLCRAGASSARSPPRRRPSPVPRSAMATSNWA